MRNQLRGCSFITGGVGRCAQLGRCQGRGGRLGCAGMADDGLGGWRSTRVHALSFGAFESVLRWQFGGFVEVVVLQDVE